MHAYKMIVQQSDAKFERPSTLTELLSSSANFSNLTLSSTLRLPLNIQPKWRG